MIRYTDLTPSEIQATFSETGVGMHPETVRLIFSLEPHHSYTVPEMVRTLVTDGRRDRRFKLIEARLNNFIRDHAIKHISMAKTNRRPARVYLAEDIQNCVSKRNRFKFQMDEDGQDPREFVDMFARGRNRRRSAPPPTEPAPKVIEETTPETQEPWPPYFTAVLFNEPTVIKTPQPSLITWFHKPLMVACCVLLFLFLGLLSNLGDFLVGSETTIQGDDHARSEEVAALFELTKRASAEGDFHEAEALTFELLKLDMSPKIRGDAHQMLGDILIKNKRVAEARHAYQTAGRFYKEPEHRAQAQHGVALSYLLENDIDAAEDALDALAYQAPDWRLLKGLCRLFAQDYDAALACNDQDKKAINQVHTALVQAMRGDLVEARRANIQAMNLAMQQRDQTAYLYSLINTALIDRLQGNDSVEVEAAVQEHLAQHPDPLIEKVYTYALADL